MDAASSEMGLARISMKSTWAEILWVVARRGGSAKFGEILKELNKIHTIPQSTLEDRINAFKTTGLITYEGGVARLTRKTPFCYIAEADRNPEFANRIQFAYLGLLGTLETRQAQIKVSEREPETRTAVKLLESELGREISRIVVVTTREAVESWKFGMNHEFEKRIEYSLTNIEEYNDIEQTVKRVEPKLRELIRDYIVILDCTSGTRPAGIAYYLLSDKHKTPLIYVYEKTRQIYWLKSRESLREELSDFVPKWARRSKH